MNRQKMLIKDDNRFSVNHMVELVNNDFLGEYRATLIKLLFCQKLMEWHWTEHKKRMNMQHF